MRGRVRLVVAVVLLGCASPPAPAPAVLTDTEWVYDGEAEKAFFADKFDCLQRSTEVIESTARAYGTLVLPGERRDVVNELMFEACMRARGWERRPEGASE